MNRIAHATACTSRKTGKPVRRYDDRASAEAGARTVAQTWGDAMVPYACGRCGGWHLSPAARQTPCHTCRHCTDGSGRTKQSYATEAAARQRAKILEREKRVQLRVYRCPHGDGWHLTSRGA